MAKLFSKGLFHFTFLPAVHMAFKYTAAAATAAKSLQSCPTLCDPHRLQPTRLSRPWASPGKNTGVGCHFLLQCMKVNSESEVTQWCRTLSDPMDCSLPGSSVHGIFQARVLEWGAIAFSAKCWLAALKCWKSTSNQNITFKTQAQESLLIYKANSMAMYWSQVKTNIRSI